VGETRGARKSSTSPADEQQELRDGHGGRSRRLALVRETLGRLYNDREADPPRPDRAEDAAGRPDRRLGDIRGLRDLDRLDAHPQAARPLALSRAKRASPDDLRDPAGPFHDGARPDGCRPLTATIERAFQRLTQTSARS
jgi:hypothetical protein